MAKQTVIVTYDSDDNPDQEDFDLFWYLINEFDNAGIMTTVTSVAAYAPLPIKSAVTAGVPGEMTH